MRPFYPNDQKGRVSLQDVCAIILAAGDGKRMKSKSSKVLCEVLFKPMLKWVLDSCFASGIETVCTVVSDNAKDVLAIVPEHCAIAVQKERRGTGHAVMMAREFLESNGEGDVLLLYGDTPFVDEETIRAAYEAHRQGENAVTVVTAELENPFGYGRILRKDGKFAAIVEEKDASEEERAIREINSGIYWFRTSFLLAALEKITCDNAAGEYYITDTVSIAKGMGKPVGVYRSPRADVVLGANDRRGLHRLNEIARVRVLDKLMDAGVDIPVTDGVIVSPDAVIGTDTRILPGTIIRGKTRIGEGCEIGPNSEIVSCRIGNGVRVHSSLLEDSAVEDGVRIGPFAHLRPNTTLKAGVKVGNFVEVKNSVVGEKTSIAHLTYIGDSDVGAGVNFGCGVVTANYDGAKKHRTVVGDGAFICCNTNLIAPVTLGEGCITGAGTTVTDDVPPYALAIGRPRQENKENWAKEKGKYRKK